jgi:hypothetical protein
MKRITSLLLAIAFAGAILLPVAVTVNNTFSNEICMANGPGPTPPLPPCLLASADDSPLLS